MTHYSDADFDVAYQTYYPLILRYFIRRTGDRVAAEEIAQETFVLAWRNWRRLLPESNIRAWVFTIARNQFLGQWRTVAGRDRPLSLDLVFENSHEDFGSSVAAGQDTEANEADRDELDRALAGLEQTDRRLLVLFGCGYSYKELCKISGISMSALKSRLHRARARLAESLKKGEANAADSLEGQP